MGIFDDPVGSLGSMLSPEKGYENAEKVMKEYLERALGLQMPFQKAGVDQLPYLTGAEGMLLDPATLLSKWMDKYQMSPYARTSMENARNSGLDAASQMGLSGSSAALQNVQRGASDIMNKDRSDFLKNLMQKYLAGIQIGQNIYGLGAQTAGNMGNQLAQAGGTMGDLEYGKTNAAGQRLLDLGKIGASIYGGGGGGGGY